MVWCCHLVIHLIMCTHSEQVNIFHLLTVTLTFELDLDSVRANICSTSDILVKVHQKFSCIVHTRWTHTHTLRCMIKWNPGVLIASLGVANAAGSLAQHPLFRPGVLPGSPFLSPLFPWHQPHPLHAMLQQTLGSADYLSSLVTGNDSNDSSRVRRSSLSLCLLTPSL